MDDILKLYLADARSLQNYLVGFSLLQSIAFLYALEKLLPTIYKSRKLISLALIILPCVNSIIILIAGCYEQRILKSLLFEKSLKEKPLIIVEEPLIIDISKQAILFRLGLILIISIITLIIFQLAAKNFKKPS